MYHKTLPEKLLLDTGFIDRDGKFIFCHSYQHFDCAKEIIKSLNLLDIVYENYVDYLIEKLGYIEIQSDWLKTDKVRFIIYNSKPPSYEQIRFIKRYIENHKENIDFEYLKEDLSDFMDI